MHFDSGFTNVVYFSEQNEKNDAEEEILSEDDDNDDEDKAFEAEKRSDVTSKKTVASTKWTSQSSREGMFFEHPNFLKSGYRCGKSKYLGKD